MTLGAESVLAPLSDRAAPPPWPSEREVGAGLGVAAGGLQGLGRAGEAGGWGWAQLVGPRGVSAFSGRRAKGRAADPARPVRWPPRPPLPGLPGPSAKALLTHTDSRRPGELSIYRAPGSAAQMQGSTSARPARGSAPAARRVLEDARRWSPGRSQGTVGVGNF